MIRTSKACALVVLVACGSQTPPQIMPPQDDAAIADAAVIADAPADADEAARVDVLVRELAFRGEPDPTAIVIFSDPDGNLISHGMVDGQGRAHGYLPNGGTVTRLRRRTIENDDFVDIVTLRGVNPGDAITFGMRIQKHRLETGVVDNMVATYTPFDSSTHALVKPCHGNAAALAPVSTLLLFAEDCTTPTFDLLALSSGTERAFVWVPDIPYVGGGGVTVPDTWQPMGTQTTHFDNLPAGTTQLAVDTNVLVGPLAVRMGLGQFDLSPAAPTVTSAWPTGAGRGTFVRAVRGQGFSELEQHSVFDPASPATLVVDLAALPLPKIPQRAQQKRTGVTWTETGMPGGDARYVEWRARYIDGDGKDHFFTWVTIEDPTVGTTATTLPGLPDAYADSDPLRVLAVVLVLTGANVMYIDYDNVDGYDAARQNPLALTDLESSYLDGARHAHRTRSP